MGIVRGDVLDSRFPQRTRITCPCRGRTPRRAHARFRARRVILLLSVWGTLALWRDGEPLPRLIRGGVNESNPKTTNAAREATARPDRLPALGGGESTPSPHRAESRPDRGQPSRHPPKHVHRARQEMGEGAGRKPGAAPGALAGSEPPRQMEAVSCRPQDRPPSSPVRPGHPASPESGLEHAVALVTDSSCSPES